MVACWASSHPSRTARSAVVHLLCTGRQQVDPTPGVRFNQVASSPLSGSVSCPAERFDAAAPSPRDLSVPCTVARKCGFFRALSPHGVSTLPTLTIFLRGQPFHRSPSGHVRAVPVMPAPRAKVANPAQNPPGSRQPHPNRPFWVCFHAIVTLQRDQPRDSRPWRALFMLLHNHASSCAPKTTLRGWTAAGVGQTLTQSPGRSRT